MFHAFIEHTQLKFTVLGEKVKQWGQLNTSGCCGSDVHMGQQEFWSILPCRSDLVPPCPLKIYFKWLTWGLSTLSLLHLRTEFWLGHSLRWILQSIYFGVGGSMSCNKTQPPVSLSCQPVIFMHHSWINMQNQTPSVTAQGPGIKLPKIIKLPNAP